MTSEATILAHPAAQPPSYNVIAIASGKGGVGKTWLAVTLSHALAQTGRRVLLFDGDIGLANVDTQLGLMPDKDLGSVITGHLRLAEAVTSFDNGGFDIIPGKSGSGALTGLSESRLCDLRHELFSLAGANDLVIADLGAGIDTGVRTFAAATGPILCVVTDEPTSLTDGYAFIKLTAMHQPGADLQVVVNMAASKPEGRRTYEKLRRACEAFLKIVPSLAGIVRRDAKAKDAIRHQTALMTRHPTSDAAGDVAALAKRLNAGP